jgi:hypothetical protein
VLRNTSKELGTRKENTAGIKRRLGKEFGKIKHYKGSNENVFKKIRAL